MASSVQRLKRLHKIQPPDFVPSNLHYEVIMGSMAYGVSSDSSDMDIYGFCIPPKHFLFPHLAGKIAGFGRQEQRFDQYVQHHIQDETELSGKGKTYDLSIYNIAKYFHLCMENNPNMVDSLFVPLECVLHSTAVGNHVRQNRHKFLHKGSYHKFRGYAFSQLHKADNKNHEEGSNRAKIVEKFGFDCKFYYHVARLMDEAEQILSTGDLDLRRSKEYLKAIRRGEVKPEEVRALFAEKEKTLESLYANSKLPHSPDQDEIKQLLIECLEMHYGSLEAVTVSDNELTKAIEDIERATTVIRRACRNI